MFRLNKNRLHSRSAYMPHTKWLIWVSEYSRTAFRIHRNISKYSKPNVRLCHIRNAFECTHRIQFNEIFKLFSHFEQSKSFAINRNHSSYSSHPFNFIASAPHHKAHDPHTRDRVFAFMSLSHMSSHEEKNNISFQMEFTISFRTQITFDRIKSSITILN